MCRLNYLKYIFVKNTGLFIHFFYYLFLYIISLYSMVLCMHFVCMLYTIANVKYVLYLNPVESFGHQPIFSRRLHDVH